MALTTDLDTIPRADLGGERQALAPARRVPIDVDPAVIGAWQRPLRAITPALLNRWLDVTVDGGENVPIDGPAIIAANHLSFIDSPLLMTELRRPVTFLGKAEYMANRVTRHVFPRAGMIPVDRSGRGIGCSLRLALDRLANGELVGIFPEGTRSRTGELLEGQLGAAHLALNSGAPIIPVGIIGTAEALPVDKRLPLRGAPIIIRVGAPVDLGPLRDRRPTAANKQALTDELMATIGALSGQRP